MALFSRDHLNPGVRRSEVFGWAMYDFANSGYTTVVITAVFSAYFVGGVAGGAPWATLAWTLALGASHLVVMFSMPALGAYADLYAVKKRLLVAVSLLCVAFTLALAWVGPGEVALALALVLLSNTFFGYGESLASAFLPELARPAAMGRVSGWGWSLGYLGGMLTLGLCLGHVLWAQAQGHSAAQFVPITMLITGASYGLAALVTFVLLKERSQPRVDVVSGALGASLRRLRQTWLQARSYQDFVTLLVCAVAYQAGVAVAIALAAIYAEQVIGFESQETMILIFALNLAAAAGAFVWGYLQDSLGHKLALSLTLFGWMLTCALAALSQDKADFWVAAAVAGVCMGSSQSAGRAMVGLFAPRAQSAEFYGLWSFATRAASVVGPVSYGLITWLTHGNQRLAIFSTTLLFLAGLLVLTRLDVARGRAAAQVADDADAVSGR